jgi:hypothetical protein
MLGSEDFMVIQALVQRGVYLCDIAQQLGVHPRTVRRALQGGGPPRRRGGRRGSVLDPYRPAVDQLLTEGVWNAVVIWRELQAKGYSGWRVDPAGLHATEAGPPAEPGDGAVRDRAGAAAPDGLGDTADGHRRAGGRRPFPGEHAELLPSGDHHTPHGSSCTSMGRQGVAQPAAKGVREIPLEPRDSVPPSCCRVTVR